MRFFKVLICLVSFTVAYSINLNAVSTNGRLPKQIGGQQLLTPVSALSPDPVLTNLPTVMDNWFIRPTYPGTDPFPDNYLAGITYDFYTYSLYVFAVNPCDDSYVYEFRTKYS